MRFPIFLAFLALASGCSSTPPENNKGTKAVLEERINVLEKEIEKLERKAFNEEMEGQMNLRSNYRQFADELEQAEKLEDQAKVKKKELKKLQDELKQFHP